MSQELRCAAIVACRNEHENLKKFLPRWLEEGLEVILLDHSSTDETLAWAKEHRGRGIKRIETLAWKGHFDLKEQLLAKQKIIEQLEHEWVLHLDADEWPQSNRIGERLIDAIRRLDSQGCNAINFEEFVFLPTCKGKEAEHYYFFAPKPKRLMRGWQRATQLSNTKAGGHELSATSAKEVKLADEDFVLRHYIVRSQGHARKKYLNRIFSPDDLKRGWHCNRIQLCARSLTFPDAIHLQQLTGSNSISWNRSEPKTTHYWHWHDNTKTKRLDTLVCLYGCDQDEELLEVFDGSELGNLIRNRQDARLVEVWAGGERDEFHGRRLTLATPEQYEKLSLKTHRMMRYCCRNFRFRQLIKLDLSCMRHKLAGIKYQGRQPIDQRALLQFIQNRMEEPLTGGTNYNGLFQHTNPQRRGIENWALKKGASISLETIFPNNTRIPNFFSGKCYVVSYKLAISIARHGHSMATDHATYLNGSEDLMVGRFAEQLKSKR
ncbi:glycosyltransferase [Synechococcus sp. MU1611]|uniref:glycosyltransferase n=1 Tax=Synechococcus sp. MU1611 TaxID=2508345 RepID=UPI001CF91C61|nr:glycosyltransferase [Synechococcus sp. MU1611]MCB4411512.1 glycosyltransferase [Synechococcus sp. MU1611]